MKFTFPSHLFTPTLEKDFSHWVRKRYSCRTFQSESLSPEDQKFLTRICSTLTTDSGMAGIRFHLVRHAQLRDRRMFMTGTYGMLRNTDAYLVGVLRSREREDWLRLGFAMEAAVLAATTRGIGSCWVGGVFDRRTFSGLVNLDPSESVPAVIALGYPAERASLRDKVVRWSARGATRFPFEKLFFHNQWDGRLDPATHPRLTPLLENVRWAPSASNRQPWRIVVSHDSLSLYLVRTPGYSRLIPDVDLQAIDMGIAICHLEGSARELKVSLNSRGTPTLPGDHGGEPVITYSWE